MPLLAPVMAMTVSPMTATTSNARALFRNHNRVRNADVLFELGKHVCGQRRPDVSNRRQVVVGVGGNAAPELDFAFEGGLGTLAGGELDVRGVNISVASTSLSISTADAIAPRYRFQMAALAKGSGGPTGMT
jgi:hypothetical protein